VFDDEELRPRARSAVRRTTAQEILNLTVCEPALGSGAFAIEAVRQLAAEYLSRRQKELGQEIPADEYAKELQKVKAHIALHQIHGVDLNSTAVELAEVSLWLDTMVPGLQAPWFGLRLRRGNSLIGARSCGALLCAASAPRRKPPAAQSRCGAQRPPRAVRSPGSRSRSHWRRRILPTSACAW
jgi:hypothetical protein